VVERSSVVTGVTSGLEMRRASGALVGLMPSPSSGPVLRHACLSALAATLGLVALLPLGAANAATAPPPYRTVPGEVLRPAPWRMPVSTEPLTGRFGDVSGLWSSTHTGLDFAAPSGTPIRSATAGVVVATGYDGAYGYRTVVRNPAGTMLWYCHQSDVDVHPGERVHRGEPIGAVGTTGNVTGAHLHLEVHPAGGAPVDPYATLIDHGVPLAGRA
jgi:murein DD-endopeptidase MepM/ murein hydrolase activator NlpD